MKALTFEKWYPGEKHFIDRDILGVVEETWNAARIGMVPEDECVRLPKVEKWPEDAQGILIGYDANGNGGKESSVFQVIDYIPCPALAWRPKVGDGVFWRTSAQILKFMGPSMREGYYVLSNGVGATLDELKPAKSIDQIGKPWEEIPNGLS